MSNVSGTVSVALSLSDSTTLPTKTVLKSLGLNEDAEVTAGRVAIVSGTIGTASVSVELSPTVYRNASGNFVSFSESLPPTRIALSADNANQVRLYDQDFGQLGLYSSNGSVAVSNWGDASPVPGLMLECSGGTNTYTIIVLREE